MSIAEGDQSRMNRPGPTAEIRRGAFSKPLKQGLFFVWQKPSASNSDADPRRKPPKNLSKHLKPDAALAAVVGKRPAPRTELTKKL